VIVGFDSCFDGRRLHDEGWLAVEEGVITEMRLGDLPDRTDARAGFLMPAPTDMAGGVFGYEEGFPERDALAPLERCLREYGRAAVAEVVDTVQPLHTVRALAGADGPGIAAAGGVIDAAPVSRPTARVAADEHGVAEEVSSAAEDGARIVAAGRYLPHDLVLGAAERAREHDLPLFAGWGSEPRPILDGAVYTGLAPLAHGMRAWSALPGLLEDLERPEGESVLVDWARRAAEAGATVVPLLTLFARRLSLPEVVSDPGWQGCLDFLPYAEHVGRMRGPVGLTVGRKKLLERTWIGNDSGLAGRALTRLGGILQEFVERGGRLGLGSGFPEFGVFPATGLGVEARALAAAGIEPETVLAAATAVPGEILHDGRRGALEPGSEALLVTAEAPPETGWPGPLTPFDLTRETVSYPVPTGINAIRSTA
jgi:hypothetical protein